MMDFVCLILLNLGAKVEFGLLTVKAKENALKGLGTMNHPTLKVVSQESVPVFGLWSRLTIGLYYRDLKHN